MPVLCLEDEGNACARKSDCMTYPLWEKLNDAINEVVDNTTLQDLIDEDIRRHMVTIDTDE